MSRSCQIGNYAGADRVYVFDWETDQKDSLSNTFEWCADEVTPEIDNLQAIPVSLMPNWVKRFEDKEVIVINDLEATKYSEPEEYELLKDCYRLDADKMSKAPENMLVMHPLPRVNEIATEVDNDKRAVYFQQAKFGMYVRMALIMKLLGVSLDD